MCQDSQPPVVETTEIEAPRRGFLRAAVAALLGLVVLPARAVRAKKVGLMLAKVEELKTVGGSKTLKVKDQEILLVRDGKSSIRAINPMCTHKKCKVGYKPSSNDLFCKCHKSSFKLDGTVMSGPAPRPLGTYPAARAGEQIIITLP